MAMLAEPRRKQKIINLRAKNNAWSNDSTKFGQRMLEKMGWTSGKGLGANENGITEHVIARYKNDDKGLGFEDKNDQWTKHEDDFNALLANLSNANDNTENLHSGVSLEDKSKKSKARIHYHKFTRGKDISRYSEKDLANIFGKKSFKNTETVDEPLKEDLKTTEQVFTEKGSMDDYFKKKLAAIKSKNKVNIKDSENNDEPDYAFRGFSQESDEKNDEEENNGFVYNHQENVQCTDNYVEGTFVCDSENIKKKKKKSKNKDNVKLSENFNELSSDMQYNPECFDSEECNVEKIKKKEKSKTNISNDDLSNCDTIEETDASLKKKKSKKKDQLQPSSTDQTVCDISVEGAEISKKKKKNKNKERSDKDLETFIPLENCAGVQNKSKKHKNIEYSLEDIPQVPKKKKKKKSVD